MGIILQKNPIVLLFINVSTTGAITVKKNDRLVIQVKGSITNVNTQQTLELKKDGVTKDSTSSKMGATGDIATFVLQFNEVIVADGTTTYTVTTTGGIMGGLMITVIIFR